MSVQKINAIINNIHTVINSTDNIESKVKLLFKYYKDFDVLRDKEYKKFKDNLIDNDAIFNMLESILNDCPCFAACKTKKVKRELLLCLLSDFLDFINSPPYQNYLNINDKDKEDDNVVIKLKYTTRELFFNYQNFIINEPVCYKCKINVVNDLAKLTNISLNSVYSFDILSNIIDPCVRDKLALLIAKFNK
jgi:hypothetical protein